MGAIEPPPPRVSRARPGAPLHAPRPRARQPRGPDHDSATRTATIPTDTPSDDRGWHGSDEREVGDFKSSPTLHLLR
ncbi:hypothetical protein MRX96_019728 [Rhipicephalus microplus]